MRDRYRTRELPLSLFGVVVRRTPRRGKPGIDLKQAEERRLRKSESLFRAIAACAYDWESWVDVNGRLVWVNPSVFRLTGYTVEECVAMKNYPLPLIDEGDRGRMARLLEQALQGSTNNDVEFRFRCKDGGGKWASISWQPLYDDTGLRLGYRSSVHDITERKRSEEEQGRFVARLQEELARAKALKGFLPICASCKKIRDEKGNWEQIEIYLRDRSGVEFTHSVCPECAKRLFPDHSGKKRAVQK